MTRQDRQSTEKNCVTQSTFLVIFTGHRNIKALTLNTIVNQNATSDLVKILQRLLNHSVKTRNHYSIHESSR